MSALRHRLDRLDGGGDGLDPERMTDAQLLRSIARAMPDPAAFLALSSADQDKVIDQLCEGSNDHDRL